MFMRINDYRIRGGQKVESFSVTSSKTRSNQIEVAAIGRIDMNFKIMFGLKGKYFIQGVDCTIEGGP